ncbi:MAG: recombinase family protein [Pseudomonadota bacterium]|nr:recombinase family protein [Pseudomonadota bacterium]
MKKKPHEPAPDIRLVGYARVSTVEQNLNLQTDALRHAGVMDDNLHVEKLSATSKRRPALDMAIKDLRPLDTLVVWRLDRLARNMQELYTRLDQIKEAGASFRSLTEHFDFESATGQLILGFLGLMAQFERQLTVERTKAGMKALKERGHKLGREQVFTPAKQARAVRIARKTKSVAKACRAVGVSKATFYGYYSVKRIITGEGKRKKQRLVITKR